MARDGSMGLPEWEIVMKKTAVPTSWILIRNNGEGTIFNVDKYAIMKRVNIRARDLRIVSPLSSPPLLLSSLSLLNLKKFTSLANLHIVGCDNLVSLPEGGLPPSLQVLQFGDCEAVEKKMLDECAFHKMSSLTNLDIEGGFSDEVCFPFPAQESQSLLLPTLNYLGIEGLSNLESL